MPTPHETPMVHAALITAPLRTRDVIFGRLLLERLMLACERVGVSRFFIETKEVERAALDRSLGSFRGRSGVHFVSGMSEALRHVPAGATCVALSGNLALSAWHLNGLIARQAARSDEVLALESADEGHGGTVAVGPLGK